MCAETLSCQANTILLQTPVTSDSYDLSVPSSTVISEPRVIGCDIDVPFGSECSTVSHSLRVSILTHLLKKASLIRIERCTNLWL